MVGEDNEEEVGRTSHTLELEELGGFSHQSCASIIQRRIDALRSTLVPIMCFHALTSISQCVCSVVDTSICIVDLLFDSGK